MIKLNDFVTKCLHSDKNNMCNILAILDFDETWNKDLFVNYLNEIIDKNTILKNYIEQKDDNFYWMEDSNVCFNVDNFYTIQNENYKNFDNATNTVLNYAFLSKYKWHFTVLNDYKNNKSRIYLKIDHSYCDGYNLIDILTSPLNQNYQRPDFKRKTNNLLDTFYYFIIGTILLIILNVKIIWKLFFTKKDDCNTITYSNNKMNNIHCGVIKLNTIKHITSKYKVTVNTFLYALMIKTWYNYNKKSSDNVVSISPINTNNTPTNMYNTNNIFFIFSDTAKCNDNVMLFRKIEEQFNLYKFSPFIPITNKLLLYLLPYVSQDFQTQMCNELFYNINLSFSNIIGPNIDDTKFNKFVKLNNMQFSTVTKNNEICFNMISFKDEININISFREKLIKHKKRFMKCFQRAYNSLTAL
jgi:hypothetical protein